MLTFLLLLLSSPVMASPVTAPMIDREGHHSTALDYGCDNPLYCEDFTGIPVYADAMDNLLENVYCDNRYAPYRCGPEYPIFVYADWLYDNGTVDEIRESAIEAFLKAHTASDEEYQAVDDILADTVLEGDSCEELWGNELSPQCKADLLSQIEIERHGI